VPALSDAITLSMEFAALPSFFWRASFCASRVLESRVKVD
jgi:hypothetical protein